MPVTENTVGATFERLRDMMGDIVPDFELLCKAELVFQINQLKRERDVVILGHNYMEPALYHGVADHVGDSLELSRIAASAPQSTIVFCGVRFMAETAKILSPDKTVLLPARVAGCSLAASITAEDVRDLKRRYPGAPVVTYVNTYADVKAESDACCTSSNAAAVIESFDAPRVIFLPDEYLAKNVARETNKRIIFPTKDDRASSSEIEYALVGWSGKCEVHDQFKVSDIENVRKDFPDVRVLAHPECPPEVAQAADFSGSTSAMIRYVRDVEASRYLLLTECSMGDNIAAENPDKEMLRLCSVRCPHMREITLEDTLAALQKNQYQIEVPEEIRVKAKRALDRMIGVNPKPAASMS